MAGNLLGLLFLLALTIFFGWLALRAWRSKRTLVRLGGVFLSVLLVLVFGLVTTAAARGLYQFYSPRHLPVPQISIAGTAGQVRRGEQIARVACKHCHSSNERLPLSGGTDVSARSPVPIGSLVPFNLTPAGPLREWTDGEIFRAVRSGVDRKGRPLIAMSSLTVRYLSDEDLLAVIAYLRSQPPVETSIRGGDHPNLLFALFAGSNLIPEPDRLTGVVISPPKGPTAAYGEYIVGYLGCRDCHGANLNGGKAGGLTPVGPSLVAAGYWSQAQFIHTIRTGVTPSGHALDPVKMFWKDFSLLDDDELAAIHAYLQTLNNAQARGNP